MENSASNRRWSKVHISFGTFSSFCAWRGGRKNRRAGHGLSRSLLRFIACAADAVSHQLDAIAPPSLLASINIAENGELPAASNGEESASIAGVSEHSLDETVATIDVPTLSLDEIMAKTDNFSAMYCIGQGSHASVFYYYVTENKRPVAVKKLDEPLKHLSKQELLTQIAVASRLKQENFLELLGYRVADDLLLLAYEFASMGSLRDILHGRKGVQGSQRGPAIPWRRRVGIALDAAKGLEYLHRNNIVHRNVRSSNVLLFHGFGAKVADYDLFKQAPGIPTRHISSQVLGSFAYHPPEYVMFGIMTRKSDVYSFGVVLLELLTGRKPVDGKTPSGHQSLVNWGTPKLTPEKVQQIVDPRLCHEYSAKGIAKLATLAAACLRFEPESRPPMSLVVRTLQAVVKFEQ